MPRNGTMQRRRFRHMHTPAADRHPMAPLAHLTRDVTQLQLYWEDENLESVTSRRIHESERGSPKGRKQVVSAEESPRSWGRRQGREASRDL